MKIDSDAESFLWQLFKEGIAMCFEQALVHSLLKDEIFAALSEYEKKLVTDRILEEVRGRMMEDIVLLESMKATGKDKRIFKLQFTVGEFDMVVYNEKENNCTIYEIKHSDQIVSEQYRHLIDEEKCQQTERRFGKIVKRCVLYRGIDYETEEGIMYQDVGEYLRHLI